jgi:nitroreductase
MTDKRLAPEIAERQSMTNWTHDSIPEPEWELLFEAARSAPSSWNHQPARYIAIKDVENIHKVCRHLHLTNKWAKHAAGLIVQVAHPDDDDRIAGKDYYLYDCGLAMMSLVYQAQVLGITARQMIGFDEASVKASLDIPERYQIVVITAIGYPSFSPLPRALAQIKRRVTHQHKRFALEHVLFWEHWEGIDR